MRGRKGSPDPGEPWLADLLRSEADSHEPDLEGVRRRVAATPQGGGGSRSGSVPGSGSGSGSVPGQRQRQRRGAAWAAAGFVLATAAGGIAVASMSDVLVADGHAGPVRVIVSESPRTPAGRATPSGTPGGPVPPTPAGTPPPAVTLPPVTPPATGAGTASPTRSAGAAAPAPLEVRAAAAGHVVSLTGARDWLVAGGRADGTAVRSASGGQVLGGPHVTGDPRTAVAAGPFRVSWRGGSPDATGSAVDGWLSVRGRDGGPRTGFVVAAPAGASSLTLYTGAGPAGARVTVRAGGRAVDAAALPAGGHVVTIAPARYGAVPVEVLVDARDAGLVALAAAVLR